MTIQSAKALYSRCGQKSLVKSDREPVQGKTIIKDSAELRVKECDRLKVIATQLNRMGVKISEHFDGLEISGGKLANLIINPS